MKRRTHMKCLPSLAALAVAGALVVSAPLTAFAQAVPNTTGPRLPDPNAKAGVGSAETQATGGGNYDYFTAHLRHDLAMYLNAVTNRHASERVWALYWQGRYTEPTADCEYVLQRFPNHPRALHLLGEIAKATNNVSMPIPFYEYALGLYPQYAFTHAQYGNYLISIGVNQAGVAQLREALRLDPKQFQARAWLAEALAQHPELAKDEPPVAAKPSTPEPPPATKATPPSGDSKRSKR